MERKPTKYLDKLFGLDRYVEDGVYSQGLSEEDIKAFEEHTKMRRQNKPEFYKNEPTDAIWWINTSDEKGVWEFSFDKKVVFNLFSDYPHKLTAEQKEIFDRENPFWADFFSDRQ